MRIAGLSSASRTAQALASAASTRKAAPVLLTGPAARNHFDNMGR